MKPPALLYVYDPLCGWCYGFTSVLDKLHAAFHDRLSFDVLSGGMIMGDRVGPIGQVAPYIKRAYKDVENRTGVTFGEKFLNEVLEPGTAVFSSEKPCIALTAFKSYQPEQVVSFAHALQHAVYYDGKDLTDDAIYPDLVKPYGIDGDNFVQKLNSTDSKRKTHEEFKIVGEMGISGFPTVLLLTQKQNYLLARGYTDFEPLHQTIEKILTA